MGNFRNTLASMEAFTSFGFANGIVQYVAEHRQNKALIERFINALLRFMLGVLALVSLAVFLFRQSLDTYLFEGAFTLPSLFICLAFVFPLQVLNGVWVAFLSGLEQFKKVIYLNIIGNVSGLLITLYLVYFHGLSGALFALVLSPAVLFFISLYWVKKELTLRWVPFDFTLIKPLFSYAIMALFSAVVSPLCYLWVRKLLMQNTSLELAGFWEGIQRISGIYMLFITTLVFTYFLPKLAQPNPYTEKKKIIKRYVTVILPLFALGLLVVYLTRDWTIPLILDQLFSKDQGYNALESMAMGQVVFTGADADFLKYYNLKEDQVCIQARPDLDDLVEKLSQLIENKESIQTIGKQAAQFVTDVHACQTVAKQYLNLWESKN